MPASKQTRVKVRERREKVFEMVLEGKTNETIARALGVKVSTIKTDRHIVTKDYLDRSEENLRRLAGKHAARLERIMDKLFPKVVDGDSQATKAYFEALDRALKMTGVDKFIQDIDFETQQHTFADAMANITKELKRK